MSDTIDEKLLRECASAFCTAAGIGCTVTDAQGRLLFAQGYGCTQCELCAASAREAGVCMQTQLYGMREAERFGGSYIYSCAMGMNCFVSPILGPNGSQAQITVGPFRMLDEMDYVTYDLQECMRMPQAEIEAILPIVRKIPYVEPHTISALATMLFMAAGFIQNVSDVNRLQGAQESTAMQGQIVSYIQELKRERETPAYPFRLERAFLQALARGEQKQAQKLLNELLGHIMFAQGRDIQTIQARAYELLVLISRTAIEEGAAPEKVLALNDRCMAEMRENQDFDALCVWLSSAIKRYMNEAFNFSEMRDADIIHRTVQYMQLNYGAKTSLEDIARSVYLSPTYLCRLFKRKMGVTIMQFYTTLRIDKCKDLLTATDLPLSEIAQETGFGDQSHFTKVFKRAVGMTPLAYRRKARREAQPEEAAQ